MKTLLLFTFATLMTNELYAACKRPSKVITRHGLSSVQFQRVFNNLSKKKSYSVIDITATNIKGKVRFSAIWDKRPQAFVMSHALTPAAFQNWFTTYTKKGYRLSDISGYQSGNSIRYAAVFTKSGGAPWVAKHGMSSAQYQAFFNEYTRKGYRLKHIDAFNFKGKVSFSAIFEKRNGPAQRVRHGMNSNQYQTYFNTYANAGYKLKHADAYEVNGNPRFAAIWEKSGSPLTYHNLDSNNFQAKYTNLAYRGYNLKGLTSYHSKGKALYLGVWQSFGARPKIDQAINKAVLSHMKKYGLPSASVAVTKDECLVFAQGYGHADKKTKQLSHADTLYRIASVAKPITGIAIMKLVSEGKLSLEDRPFNSADNLLADVAYGNNTTMPGVENVTIRQLLNHSSGWSNAGGDPQFNSSLTSYNEIFAFMLGSRGLARMPGADDEYLNFGYNVLGRVIEKVSGLSYEKYVQRYILRPAGITKMKIAAKTKAKKAHMEATYYPESSAYSVIRPRLFDAHGGWIASSVDLVKLLVRIDKGKVKRDILSEDAVSEMILPTGPDAGYAKGFIANGENYGHNGEMAGTGAFMWKTDTGYTWAFLTNSRPDGDEGSFKFLEMMNDLVNSLKGYTPYDLF